MLVVFYKKINKQEISSKMMTSIPNVGDKIILESGVYLVLCVIWDIVYDHNTVNIEVVET